MEDKSGFLYAPMHKYLDTQGYLIKRFISLLHGNISTSVNVIRGVENLGCITLLKPLQHMDENY